LIKNAILENEFLNNLEQGQIKAVIAAMYAEEYKADSNVITEGEPGLLYNSDHCSETLFFFSTIKITGHKASHSS
jgi:hypothetical protein